MATMRGLLAAAAAAALLLVAPAAHAGGPSLIVGAAEDDVKAGTLIEAEGEARPAAGSPGSTPCASRRSGIPRSRPDRRRAEPAEQPDRRRPSSTASTCTSSVYNFGSKTTPLTDDDQASFAGHAAALARAGPRPPELHHRQRAEPEPLLAAAVQRGRHRRGRAGVPVAARRTYTALKAVDPTVTVFGGAISPRGIDRPGTGRDTHSPTVFIQDLGAAYRASGLTGPVMDALAIHPYPENSSIPPTFAHPNTTPIGIADYAKLVGAARPRPSTAPPSPARRCRSSTPSTGSRPRSPRRRRRCTRAPSRRRSSPSPSRRRRRTTGRRWRCRSASRT